MRYIAPILIALLIAGLSALYGFGIIFALNSMGAPFIIKIAVTIVFAGLITALVYTLIQRIKEIRKEDEDDLSKY